MVFVFFFNFYKIQLKSLVNASLLFVKIKKKIILKWPCIGVKSKFIYTNCYNVNIACWLYPSFKKKLLRLDFLCLKVLQLGDILAIDIDCFSMEKCWVHNVCAHHDTFWSMAESMSINNGRFIKWLTRDILYTNHSGTLYILNKCVRHPCTDSAR